MHDYTRKALGFLLVSLACACQPMCAQAKKIGASEEVKYRVDLTGDGVQEVVVLQKTVTDMVTADRPYYAYDVQIIVLDGKKGKKLFESQQFHANEVGAFVTSGELRILPVKSGVSAFEYVETTVYTEDPSEDVVSRKRFLFRWTGSQIEVKETEEKI